MVEGQSSLSEMAEAIRRCTECPLFHSRQNAVPGEGPSGAILFLVGEAPGSQEDLAGRPFIGRAGLVLSDALDHTGLRRNEVFITSAVKCRPPSDGKPTRAEVATCSGLYLIHQIEAVGPACIVTLGNFGLQALMGWHHVVGRVHGQVLRYKRWPLIPTYHPAASFRNPRTRELLKADLGRAGAIAREVRS